MMTPRKETWSKNLTLLFPFTSMIREYAPIGLIPAAWAMTFATVVYPKISTYWIGHMHYFMIIFLSGFTVLSWKEMESDPVLDIWRKVIGVGILFTGFGIISYNLSIYSYVFSFSSLSYWAIAPGIALYFSAKSMDEYSDLYKKLGIGSIISFMVFLAGIYFQRLSFQSLGLIGITISQAYSILVASKLDSRE